MEYRGFLLLVIRKLSKKNTCILETKTTNKSNQKNGLWKNGNEQSWRLLNGYTPYNRRNFQHEQNKKLEIEKTTNSNGQFAGRFSEPGPTTVITKLKTM